MNRNRKKSSTQDEARPSTSAKTREENDLAYFVHDRVTLTRELFSILKPKEIKSITPECVRKLSLDNLEELCLEELLGISSKRLCAVLDGAEPPSDTESSSSDSSSSSESEMSEQESSTAVAEVICLDSDSNDDASAKSKKKKKKKKKKRKHKSTEKTSNSDATVEPPSTERRNSNKPTPSQSTNKTNSQSQQNSKTSTNAAILNVVGGRSDAFFSGQARGKESSRAAERVGMTVLEILEVQARARAIRAQMNKEQNDALKAKPSTSTNSNTQTKQDSSDSELEIKEETAEIVDLLSSSDDGADDEEEKPKVEDLEVAAVKEPDPPPASTKDRDKTTIKKSKTTNSKPTATITSEEITKSKPPEESNKTRTPEKESKRRRKSNPTVEKRLKTVNDNCSEINNLPKTAEKLLNSKNNIPNTETQVSRDIEVIKQEDEERESSPNLIILEDSNNEIITDISNKKQPEIPKSSENNEISVQSVVKVIDAPKTAKREKTKRKNDFTITVTQNAQRKVMKERNNVLISFSNVADANAPTRDGNSYFSSTQKKNRSSDIIEQSAKKLNSTVTKIIKERSKGKYVKSVVQKTSGKERTTRTNTKERDQTSHDNNNAKEKDKESDGDEITLQLSDSEKMDLLEDLNPEIFDKISENTGSYSKSSASDDSGTSSDETDKSDEQGVSVTNVASDPNYIKDVNHESGNKNDNSSKEKSEITNNDNNTAPIKQNNDGAKVSVSEEPSSKTILITSDITIPKTIINDMENRLNQPVKTIISHLRVDEMVLDEPRQSPDKCIPGNDEEMSTTVNYAEESSAKVSEVSNNTPCESNLTKKLIQNIVNNTSENKDLTPVLEIRSIRDIPILPDYESDNESSLPKDSNTNLEKEIIVVKDIAQVTTNSKSKKKLKKKRKKLNRDRGVNNPSSDDIVENNALSKDVGLRKVNEKELINENVIDDTISASRQTQGSKQIREKDENSVHRCKQTEKYSKPLVKNSGASTNVNDDETSGIDGNTIESRPAVKKYHEMATDDLLSAIQDGGETEVMVLQTPETPNEINSKDIVEQDDLEEGEIADDHKRELSEEGEITTDTESEIEAQDLVPETICISEEEICTTENIDDLTTENKDGANDKKRNKKKHLCKKCKRKKNSQKNADQNFYRNSVSANKFTQNVEGRTVDELPIDINNSNTSTLNNDVTQFSKVSNYNNTKELQIDNVSLDSESDSDSDSNTVNRSELKTQSKNLKTDKLKTDFHKNLPNIILLSPNINQTDSDTLETLEISDESSDCYEILSKEPTTEEIEALSEKIDRIERIDVVTEDEIIQHENSNDSKEISISEEMKTPKNKDTRRNNNKNCSELQNSNENVTESIADENISWKDRYIKSKKVTKVLTTSNILNTLRKKNLELKKKLLESKIVKTVEEINEVVEVVPETVEIGSIEHYNTLESSTKYVDPVKEPPPPETEVKDSILTTDPVDAAKTIETLVNTTTETQIVTKEMKKDAKQLYKMYKKLLKHNNMYKEKEPNKKKKQKNKKNKDGDASCHSDVTETVC